jgi:hypothetical protein
MQNNNPIQNKQIITVEGDVVNIDGYDMGRYIEIPLKAIKEYEWCDILNRTVPVHFREVFEVKHYTFIYSVGEYVDWITWTSKEIK